MTVYYICDLFVSGTYLTLSVLTPPEMFGWFVNVWKRRRNNNYFYCGCLSARRIGKEGSGPGTISERVPPPRVAVGGGIAQFRGDCRGASIRHPQRLSHCRGKSHTQTLNNKVITISQTIHSLLRCCKT